MTTEQERDISKQPEPTCPMIDEVIKSLRAADSHTKGYARCDDVEQLREMISCVESELFCWGSGEEQLEKIRKHVESIRQWGEEWKQYALSIEQQVAT
jgi:hypothetical protein